MIGKFTYSPPEKKRASRTSTARIAVELQDNFLNGTRFNEIIEELRVDERLNTSSLAEIAEALLGHAVVELSKDEILDSLLRRSNLLILDAAQHETIKRMRF